MLVGLAWAASESAAQQVTISTPYQAVGDSFFENMGTAWGLGGPNWNLSVFGSPNQAAPPFGGFDPSAGANFGFGFGGGGFGGNFLGNFSQGSRRSFVSQVPSITLQNGVPGSISDTSQSPFVISYIPVVGGFPTVASLVPRPPQPLYGPDGSLGSGSVVQQALQQARGRQPPAGGNLGEIEVPRPQLIEPNEPALQRGNPAPHDDLALGGDAAAVAAAAQSSSAARAAMSVAEARKLHQAEQAEQDAEVLGYVERARAAEAAGKPNVAKIYYQMAHRRAAGQLRDQIEARLRTFEPSPGTEHGPRFD